jgi:hypothetical protein
MKIKGISPVADHWRTKAEELERSLARKEALLRRWLDRGYGAGEFATLLADTERELKG